MRIIKGFDERAIYAIAKDSGSKQLKDDVKYMRLVEYSGKSIIAERLYNVAFWIGYENADHLRLVGIGVRKEAQGKGYGKFMLYRAMDYARQKGYGMIRTRTLSGVDFYQRFALRQIVGMRGNDYLMEIDL